MGGEPGGTQRTLAGGRYVLKERIGRGGVAEVWRAHDTALGVDRAIKFLHGPGQTSPRRIRRLQDEARAMAQIGHPNIVAIHDVGETEEGPYLVMELIEGGTLAELFRARGRLPAGEAVDVAFDVLEALHAAHARGIIHRDVKPSNVLLGPDGHAHLADFGIALVPRDDPRQTRTGTRMGSLNYMPPEQRSDARHVGPPSDVYALASGLYEVISGQTPVDLFATEADSPRWDAIPASLRPILFRATRYKAVDRHASAAELAAALREVRPGLEGARAAAPAPPLPEAALRAPQAPRAQEVPADDVIPARTPVLPLLAVLAVFGLGGVALWVGAAPAGDADAVAPAEAAATAAVPRSVLAGSWRAQGTDGATGLVLEGPDQRLTGGVSRLGDAPGTWPIEGAHEPSTGIVELHHSTRDDAYAEYHLRHEDGALVGVVVGPGDREHARVRFERVPDPG